MERFPGGKEFPVVRISRWERFPSNKIFQDKKDFPVARISQGEGFPGGKNFLVE